MSESIADILERRAAEAPDPEAVDPAGDAERAADDLRQQVEAQTRRADQAEQARIAADQRRQQAETEAAQVRQQVEVSNQAAVTNALSAAQAEADRLKQDMRAAADSGDYEKVADITMKLGRVGSRLEQLEAGAQSFEQQRTEALRRPEPVRQAPPDPIEADLANRTPKTREWLERNRNFYTDPKFNQQVVGADALARGKGLIPDTDAYFRFVEETVGLSHSSAPPPRGSSPPPAAPPSRETPSMTGSGRSGDVMITAEDRRIAEWQGIDAEEYAKERMRLERTPGALYKNGKR